MKLRNTSRLPDWFLRRLVGWVCRQPQIRHRVRDIQEARYRHASFQILGRAWPSERRYLVNLPPLIKKWTLDDALCPASGGHLAVRSAIQAAVEVTAHEIAHLSQTPAVLNGRFRESDADWRAGQVLDSFRVCEDDLIGEWARRPRERPAATKPTRKQANAARAAKHLTNWERKLKLAQCKVRKYRAQVRRYRREGVL